MAIVQTEDTSIPLPVAFTVCSFHGAWLIHQHGYRCSLYSRTEGIVDDAPAALVTPTTARLKKP
jgi:hypothetical protein